MEVKENLTALLIDARQFEHTYVESMSDLERSTPGLPNDWSPKDIIAHIAEWNARLAQSLRELGPDQAPPVYDDIDAENDAIYQQYHDMPWISVIERLERTNQELLEYVRTADGDTLTDPDRNPRQNNRPIWRDLAGTGYIHALLHVCDCYLKRGDKAAANHLQDKGSEALLELDDSDEWHGLVMYNQACYRALAGDVQAAVERLARALALRPDLVDWSKQDPDLDSLREEPSFRALYTD